MTGAGSQERGLTCAVVGTGSMGVALADALLGAGHKVTVWNRTAERYASLVQRGADAAESVAGAVSAAELVVVCLLDYPTTREVFETDAIADVLAGRTVLQFSYSIGSEAAAFERWVKQRGAVYLHGQIKAYPREIGTPAARLNYSGPQQRFESLREVLALFGEPFYLGPNVAAACVVSNASTMLYTSIVLAFFEAAAHAVADGGELDSFVSMVPSSVRLAVSTIEYSVGQITNGAFEGDQASINTHANGFRTLVRGQLSGEPRIARVARDYLDEAEQKGLGSQEIAAVYQMLLASLR